MFEFSKDRVVFPQPGFDINDKASVLLSSEGRMVSAVEEGSLAFPFLVRGEAVRIGFLKDYGYAPTPAMSYFTGNAPSNNNYFYFPCSSHKIRGAFNTVSIGLTVDTDCMYIYSNDPQPSDGFPAQGFNWITLHWLIFDIPWVPL